MLTIQVIPRAGQDAYKLLRDKVTHEAQTWEWVNRAKTRLQHKRGSGSKHSYIEVGSSEGIVVATVYSYDPKDAYFLVEKFVGRLVAWFPDEIAAINIQLSNERQSKRRK